MRNTFIGRRVGLFCLAVMVATGMAVTRAEAEQVAMKDLPSAVRAAAEKAIEGGSLKRVVVEKEDGQIAYSVEAMMGGNTKEFTFAADGTLLAEEEDVTFAKLPEAVRAAAEKYFGGSRDLRASKEIAKNVTSYEIEGHKGGKKVSAHFSAAGALLDQEEDKD
jgi:hypothetical protein